MAIIGGPTDTDLENAIRDECEAGKPSFAIAYGLVRVAAAGEAIAHAIHRLGTADAATPLGAVEVLSGEVGRMADAIASVAEAIGEASS